MSSLSNPFEIYFSKKLQKALIDAEAQKYAADRQAQAIENAASIHQGGETARQKLIYATHEMIQKLQNKGEQEKIGAQLPLLKEIMKSKGIDVGDELATPGAPSFSTPEMGGRSWVDGAGAHWEADTPEIQAKKKAKFNTPVGWSPWQEDQLTNAVTESSMDIGKTPQDRVAEIADSLLGPTRKKKSLLEIAGEEGWWTNY